MTEHLITFQALVRYSLLLFAAACLAFQRGQARRAGVMPELIQPAFCGWPQFLVGETERLWNANAFDELFAGSVQQMEQRWAGTAVLDNAGSWHVVRCSGHVQGEGASRRRRWLEKRLKLRR